MISKRTFTMALWSINWDKRGWFTVRNHKNQIAWAVTPRSVGDAENPLTVEWRQEREAEMMAKLENTDSEMFREQDFPWIADICGDFF
jgi:hypothetical protein